jgi:hypothetical protein
MLALQNFDEPAPEVQRDEHGRFAAKVEPEPAADEEVVYQRTIDLGDGAGVQVFEGKTMEELVDKLAKAQEHATRKIREQAAALKTAPAPLPAVELEKPLSPDEQWLLQQRMLRDPMSVINEYVQKEVQKVETARQQAEREAREAAEAQEKATNEWVESHPDYYASQKNGTKIQKYLQVQGLDLTPENLDLAFNDLSESGLLEARPAEAANAKPDAEPAAQPTRRIVEPVAPVVTTVRRKVVGSISSKRSAPVETNVSEPTEDALYKMPLAELERLTFQHLRS